MKHSPLRPVKESHHEREQMVGCSRTLSFGLLAKWRPGSGDTGSDKLNNCSERIGRGTESVEH